MRRQQGINIYGYVYAEHGIGEAARLLIECARQAGLGYAVIPYTQTGSRQDATVDDLGERAAVYDINVIIVNADSLPAFVDHFGPRILEGSYNIGIWAWEVETLPDELARSARFLDEIWAISRFTADAIAPSVSCPVLTFPLTHSAQPVPPRPREELGLSDDFLFLFCFDFNSLFDRKNPLALIEAFDRAFPTGEGAQLVIKTLNGREFSDQLERLNAAALDNPKIRIVDGYLPFDEQRVLIASCDAYVSLHRSEGFGLTLLEAMAHGKPVIATGYSGNLDFMTERNGYLVPYRMTPIPQACGPYPASARWADPDVDVAADFMRRVVEHSDEAREKGRLAKQDVESLHTPKARAPLIVGRLDAIRARLDDHPPPPPTGAALLRVEPGGEASGPTTARSQPPPSSGAYTAYATVKDLLGAQLVRFDPDRLLAGLACGSLDGALLDAAGGASIWGWAYDPRTMEPARSVILFLNGDQIAIHIPVASERPDVASFLGKPNLSETGWSLYLRPRYLGSGRNTFVAYALLHDDHFGSLAGHGGTPLVLDIPQLDALRHPSEEESVRDRIKDIDLESITDHSQHAEQRIIGRFLQETPTPYTPFFVDVGAFDGVTGSNSRFLAELGWGGIVIEPTPQAFAQLESLYAGNPAVRSIRCAVSDFAADEVEMLVAEGPEGIPEDHRWHYSQVSTLNPWFAKGFVEEHGYRYRSVRVPVRPLVDLLAANDCPPDLGALFIDCEGEDLRIVRGFDFSRFQPRLLSVECDDRSRATFAEALLPHGYVEYEHTAWNTFFRLQADR